MNLPHKYNVDEVVYSVTGYQIGRSIITAKIYNELKDKIQIRYEVLCPDNKKRIYSEAYLVKTLNEAKEAAKSNALLEYQEKLIAIDLLTDEVFDQAYTQLKKAQSNNDS